MNNSIGPNGEFFIKSQKVDIAHAWKHPKSSFFSGADPVVHLHLGTKERAGLPNHVGS